MTRSPNSLFPRLVAVALAAASAAACTTTARRAFSGPSPVPPDQASHAGLPTAPPRAMPAPQVSVDLLAPGTSLNLAQVVDIALANNPVTRLSYRQARSAREALDVARAPFYPSVDVTVTGSRAKQSGQSTDGPLRTSYGPGVVLNWLVLDFGGRAGSAEEARQSLLAADWSHDAQVNNVALAVEQAFFQYQGVKALLEAASTSLTQSSTALDAATRRHEAGLATIADVLQAKTAVSQAQLQVQQLEGQVLSTRGALATAMGLPASLPFDIGALTAEPPLDLVTDTAEALITRAVVQRPDLQASRAIAERAAVHVGTASSDLLPTLTLSASANRFWYDPAFSVDPQNGTSARLLLTYPLFSGFGRAASQRKAREDELSAIAQADAVQAQVVQQVWTSYYSAKTAARQILTARDLLASAEQSERVALGRYKEGVGIFLDLLAAQSALANARAIEVQARAGWLLAVAQLTRDIGLMPRTDIATELVNTPKVTP